VPAERQSFGQLLSVGISPHFMENDIHPTQRPIKPGRGGEAIAMSSMPREAL
jgi:hypothetical protein